MRFNYKILGLVMFIMLICCVSAASATDVDNMTVPDDTDVIEIDDAVDSVDEVELEEVDEIVSTEPVTVTDENYGDYFDEDGYMTTTSDLTFTGNFTSKSFGNFKINNAVTITAGEATFNNVGFDLLSRNIILDGANFLYDTNDARIYVYEDDDIVQNLNINVVAPEDEDYYGIFVDGASNVQILNNVITYTCNYLNTENYNHVIRVVGGNNVTVSRNNITAYLPLKNVDFYQPYPSIYTDLVAGVAVQSSSNFTFTYNRLEVNVSDTDYGYPTLDALIIVDSENAYIAHNNITEIDPITPEGDNNYLYAIDVYACNHITIDDNTIRLESKGGSIIPGTNNGTGTAYGIQLTGQHNVTISNNNIHTSNNGPNAGIYSQNFNGPTNLTIINNTIYSEGSADSSHSWSLVTGMELQDNEAYIAGNTITVYNKATYSPGDNVYGISFSQYGTASPKFTITSNTVNVINGMWAVYLQYSSGASATNNSLITDYYCGDNAVYKNGDITYSGNYCPNCNGVNCHCTH